MIHFTDIFAQKSENVTRKTLTGMIGRSTRARLFKHDRRRTWEYPDRSLPYCHVRTRKIFSFNALVSIGYRTTKVTDVYNTGYSIETRNLAQLRTTPSCQISFEDKLYYRYVASGKQEAVLNRNHCSTENNQSTNRNSTEGFRVGILSPGPIITGRRRPVLQEAAGGAPRA